MDRLASSALRTGRPCRAFLDDLRTDIAHEAFICRSSPNTVVLIAIPVWYPADVPSGTSQESLTSLTKTRGPSNGYVQYDDAHLPQLVLRYATRCRAWTLYHIHA